MEKQNATAAYSISMKAVDVGPLSLRIFRLPNAMYCLCLADVLGIESGSGDIQNAVHSKIAKSPALPVSIHLEGVKRTFTPVSFEAAILYWQRRAMENNAEAQRLIRMLTKQSLRERADALFGAD